MGLNDTAEQLKVCHEVNVANEQRIAELQVAAALQSGIIAELEHENARLESALGDRLRTDRHGTAGLEAELRDARRRLARIFRLVDPRREEPEPLPASVIRRILDELTAEPDGAWLDPDDARIASRALHGLAGIIDATRWNTDGDPAHTDTGRLTAIADRLAP